MPSVYLLLAIVAVLALGAVVYVMRVFSGGGSDSCLVPTPLDRRCEWYRNYRGFCPADLKMFSSASCPEDPDLPRFVSLSDNTCYPPRTSNEVMDAKGEFCFYPKNRFPPGAWPVDFYEPRDKSTIDAWANTRFTGDCSSEHSKTWYDGTPCREGQMRYLTNDEKRHQGCLYSWDLPGLESNFSQEAAG